MEPLTLGKLTDYCRESLKGQVVCPSCGKIMLEGRWKHLLTCTYLVRDALTTFKVQD